MNLLWLTKTMNEILLWKQLFLTKIHNNNENSLNERGLYNILRIVRVNIQRAVQVPLGRRQFIQTVSEKENKVAREFSWFYEFHLKLNQLKHKVMCTWRSQLLIAKWKVFRTKGMQKYASFPCKLHKILSQGTNTHL